MAACSSQNSVLPSLPPALFPHSLHDPGAPSDWTSLGHMAMAEALTWPGVVVNELIGVA